MMLGVKFCLIFVVAIPGTFEMDKPNKGQSGPKSLTPPSKRPGKGAPQSVPDYSAAPQSIQPQKGAPHSGPDYSAAPPSSQPRKGAPHSGPDYSAAPPSSQPRKGAPHSGPDYSAAPPSSQPRKGAPHLGPNYSTAPSSSQPRKGAPHSGSNYSAAPPSSQPQKGASEDRGHNIPAQLELNGFEGTALTEPRRDYICQQLGLQRVHDRTTLDNIRVERIDRAYVHNVEGDGNCLFRALSYLIGAGVGQYHELRLAVVNYMRDHNVMRRLRDDELKEMEETFLNNNQENNYQDENIIDEKKQQKHSEIVAEQLELRDKEEAYYVDMEKNTNWASNDEINAAAHLLGINIYVYRLQPEHFTTDDNFVIPTQPQYFPEHFPRETVFEDSVFIGFVGAHYVAITGGR